MSTGSSSSSPSSPSASAFAARPGSNWRLAAMANRVLGLMAQSQAQQAALEAEITDLTANGGKATLANTQAALAKSQAAEKAAVAAAVQQAGGTAQLFTVITSTTEQAAINALLTPATTPAAPASAVAAPAVAAPAV